MFFCFPPAARVSSSEEEDEKFNRKILGLVPCESEDLSCDTADRFVDAWHQQVPVIDTIVDYEKQWKAAVRKLRVSSTRSVSTFQYSLVEGEKPGTYFGTVKDSKPDGFGRYTFADQRRFYEGEFSNGIRKGLGKIVLGGGRSILGQWNDNILDTGYPMKIVYSNGDVFWGYTTNPSKTMVFDKFQKAQGKLEIAHRGEQFFGYWENDKRTGFGILLKPHGERYYGLWEHDAFCGRGMFFFADGTILEGTWVPRVKRKNSRTSNSEGGAAAATANNAAANFESDEQHTDGTAAGSGENVYDVKNGTLHQTNGDRITGSLFVDVCVCHQLQQSNAFKQEYQIKDARYIKCPRKLNSRLELISTLFRRPTTTRLINSDNVCLAWEILWNYHLSKKKIRHWKKNVGNASSMRSFFATDELLSNVLTFFFNYFHGLYGPIVEHKGQQPSARQRKRPTSPKSSMDHCHHDPHDALNHAVQEIHAVIDFLSKKLRPELDSASAEAVLPTLIQTKLHDILFPLYCQKFKPDEDIINDHLRQLQYDSMRLSVKSPSAARRPSWVISPTSSGDSNIWFQKAVEDLRSMDNKRTALEKLACLSRVREAVRSEIEHAASLRPDKDHSSSGGGDEMAERLWSVFIEASKDIDCFKAHLEHIMDFALLDTADRDIETDPVLTIIAYYQGFITLIYNNELMVRDANNVLGPPTSILRIIKNNIDEIMRVDGGAATVRIISKLPELLFQIGRAVADLRLQSAINSKNDFHSAANANGDSNSNSDVRGSLFLVGSPLGRRGHHHVSKMSMPEIITHHYESEEEIERDFSLLTRIFANSGIGFSFVKKKTNACPIVAAGTTTTNAETPAASVLEMIDEEEDDDDDDNDQDEDSNNTSSSSSGSGSGSSDDDRVLPQQQQPPSSALHHELEIHFDKIHDSIIYYTFSNALRKLQ